MHKGHAAGGQTACSAFYPVIFVGFETFALNVLLGAINSQVDGDDSDQSLAFVFGDALPRDQVDLFEGISQPVIIAEEVEVVIFMVEVAHLLTGPDFFLFQFGGIQLISEGTAHGDGGFGLEGDHGAGFRDMGAHGAYRIQERGSVVELEVVQGFGIV